MLRDLRTTNHALHERILPDYIDQGTDYPFDAIALIGCYGDLAPESADLPARKVQTVTEYNAQEWEYPKLVNASHQQFWADVEQQIDEREINLPVSPRRLWDGLGSVDVEPGRGLCRLAARATACRAGRQAERAGLCPLTVRRMSNGATRSLMAGST